MNRDYEWLFEHSEIAMIILDKCGRYLDHNKAYRELMGYSEKESLTHFHPEDVSAKIQPNGKTAEENVAYNNAKAFKDGRYEFPWLHERPDGTQFMSLVVLERIFYHDQECLWVTIHDIDEQDKVKRLVKEKVEALERNHKMMESIFSSASEGMVVINHEKSIIKCNKRLLEIIGIEEEVLVGHTIEDFFVNKEAYDFFTENYRVAILNGELDAVEYQFKKRCGEKIWCTIAGCRLYDQAEDKVYGTLWMLEDVTERKRLSEALEEQYLIAKDANPLTGLPGNNSIMARLRRAVENNEEVCFFYLDLDHFKSYNDKYGFVNGDNVLKMLAKLLENALKFLDKDGTFVGNVGGDDFVMLFNSSYMVQVAMAIVKAFDMKIKSHYSKEDIEKDHIVAVDRDGREKVFPIMSLSIAGVDLRDVRNLETLEVIDICTELKKKAKSIDGSCYIFNKRKA